MHARHEYRYVIKYVHCSEQLQHPSSSGEAGHPSPLLLGRALHRGQPKPPRRRARRRGGLGAGRRHRDRRRLLPADNVPAHMSITAAESQSRQVQATQPAGARVNKLFRPGKALAISHRQMPMNRWLVRTLPRSPQEVEQHVVVVLPAFQRERFVVTALRNPLRLVSLAGSKKTQPLSCHGLRDGIG